jgi:hypothetical protein
MATNPPTSVMDPGDSAEWQACREAIGRFDQILSSLRPYGFTLITTLIGATAFLTTIPDTQLPAPQKAGLVIALGGLITALSFVDRYYVVLQSGAGRDAVWGAQRARAAPCGPPGEAGRACGRREGVGVPWPKLHSASAHPVSGRIRTRSVQPSAIRSAQGRVCVHRGALSPEHSR